MAIYVIGAVRRTKFMIGGRILALAVQFTVAHGGAALASKQLVPQIDRQMRHVEQLDVLRHDLATEGAYWVCRNCRPVLIGQINKSDAVLLNRLSADDIEPIRIAAE